MVISFQWLQGILNVHVHYYQSVTYQQIQNKNYTNSENAQYGVEIILQDDKERRVLLIFWQPLKKKLKTLQIMMFL